MAKTELFGSGGTTTEFGDDDGKAYLADHPDATPAPAASTKPTAAPIPEDKPARQATPLIGKAAGWRAFDSATLGTGEMGVGLIDKHKADEIKQASKDYETDHPFASAAIDLLTAGAWAAVPVGDAVAGTRAGAALARVGGKLVPDAVGQVAGRLAESGVGKLAARAGDNAVVKGAATGATVGAATGGVRGFADGEPGQRMSGGVAGAAKGAGFGAVGGAVLGPIASTIGKTLAPVRASTQEITAALRSEGKTPSQLDAFMKANPDGRIADFSPAAARLMNTAGKRSDAAADKLGANVRADVDGQNGRLVDPIQKTPLARPRSDMQDDIKTLEKQRDQGYSQGRREITSMTPELKSALDHPDVQPIVKDSLKSYGELRKRDPSADVSQAPKYQAGKELPSAVLDDVQRRVKSLMDEAGTGTIKYGELQSVRNALRAGQTGATVDGRKAAAALGKAGTSADDGGSGILGAVHWGSAYSQALKKADVETFRNFSPLEQAHARLAALDGMEKYLKDKGAIGEKGLNDIARGFKTNADIQEVYGPANAKRLASIFEKEADRQRVNAKMVSGGSKDADSGAQMADVATHVAASAVGHGVGHVAMTTLKALTNTGLSKRQAEIMIDIASKPGGFQNLKSSGVSQKRLNALYAMRGALHGSRAVGGQTAGGIAGRRIDTQRVQQDTPDDAAQFNMSGKQ